MRRSYLLRMATYLRTSNMLEAFSFKFLGPQGTVHMFRKAGLSPATSWRSSTLGSADRGVDLRLTSCSLAERNKPAFSAAR